MPALQPFYFTMCISLVFFERSATLPLSLTRVIRTGLDLTHSLVCSAAETGTHVQNGKSQTRRTLVTSIAPCQASSYSTHLPSLLKGYPLPSARTRRRSHPCYSPIYLSSGASLLYKTLNRVHYRLVRSSIAHVQDGLGRSGDRVLDVGPVRIPRVCLAC